MTVNITGAKLTKIIEFVLLIGILGLLIWSQPWKGSSGAQIRKVTVTGQTTIDAVPDEYRFSPYFQMSGTDEKKIQNTLTAQANEAVKKIKELGVAEDDIKIDASSYDYWYAAPGQEGSLQVSLQVTVTDKELAQKVQDYLLTLDNIEGSLTPAATFSEAKSKELDKQATEEAINDAKSKAEQQATLLGAKVGKVLEVADSDNPTYPMPYDLAVSEGADAAKRSSLPVSPGKNEYTKTVTVTYELK